MDWSLILGILGIVVSVAVGWLTYRLANKRAFSQRYVTAKATVLQSLSKSLGEDAVPTQEVLQATIRSVLRETGDPKLQLQIDDVLDDLVRQVTSDPFLDSDRRRKLQADIQTVRSQAADKQLSPLRDFEYGRSAYLRSSAVPVVIAAFATVASLFLVLLPLSAGKNQDNVDTFIKAHPWLWVPLALVLLLGVLLPVVLFDDDMRRYLRRIFGRRHENPFGDE